MPPPMLALEHRLRALFAGAPEVEVGLHAVSADDGREVAIDADAVFPCASTFKTPLVVEVWRRAEAGALDLNARVTLEEDCKTLTSGVLQALQPGLQPTIRDLAVLAIIVSDNTATEMLVRRIGGAEAFGRAIAGLGMASTRYAFGAHGMFLHGFGLAPEATLAQVQAAALERPWDFASRTFSRGPDNTVSTARDMAGLIARLARGEILGGDGANEVFEIMAGQQYTDRIPRRLPWGRVSNKTGTIGGARSDVGLMPTPGGARVAYAMMTWDPTPLPAGNSDVLLDRTARIDRLFGEAGRLIWDAFAEGGAA